MRKYKQMEINQFTNLYNEIKQQNPEFIDRDVAKMLNISLAGLKQKKKRIGCEV